MPVLVGPRERVVAPLVNQRRPTGAGPASKVGNSGQRIGEIGFPSRAFRREARCTAETVTLHGP